MKVNYAILSISLVGILFLIGCADTKSKISFFEEKMESDHEAIIYVYRLPDIVGGIAYWNVYLDHQVVGLLKQGAYMAFHVSPGEHTITIGDTPPSLTGALVETLADNPSKFNAKANETYYIRSKGFKVEFVTKEKAMTELPSMKYDKGM